MFAVKQKYLGNPKAYRVSKHLTTFVAFMPFASLKCYKKKATYLENNSTHYPCQHRSVYGSKICPHFQLPVSPFNSCNGGYTWKVEQNEEQETKGS